MPPCTHSSRVPRGATRLGPSAAVVRAALVATLLAAAGACTVTPLSQARAQDAAHAAAHAAERMRYAPPSPAGANALPATSPAAPRGTSPRDTARATPAGAAPTAAFVWPGTYDLVGSGFPEGERQAVMTVTRRDTAYAVDVVGPPGRSLYVHVGGDTAYVQWELAAGAAPMNLWLRGTGDTVGGMWIIGDQVGLLRGRRRP